MQIPTAYRAPLQRGLAYPIGAEALSDSLAGVPQSAALALAFHRQPVLFASAFNALLSSSEPLPVLSISVARYNRLLTSLYPHVDALTHTHVWSIAVYPVPAQFKSAARESLLTSGLVTARLWLQASRTPTWLSSRHSLTLSFDRASLSLSSQESQ